ncbi:MAG: hypothetical protein HYU39_06670 [Thaumarchaeota archaeon]|nr:hypothetical protein [Nitrososphaerota archaeon]
MKVYRITLAMVVIASLITPVLIVSPVHAQPVITMKTNFLGVEIEGADRIFVPLEIRNQGNEVQEVRLRVEAPNGLSTKLQDRSYGLTSVAVDPGEKLELSLEMSPSEELAAGSYTVTIRASSPQGLDLGRLSINVNYVKARQGSSAVDLRTTYPVLKAPSGTVFVYSIDMANKSPDELSFDLSATGPGGWRVAFKPAFEDKQISTLRLKGGESKGLDVQLIPPEQVPPGTYNFTMRAAAGGVRSTIDLQAEVTGIFKVSLKTSDERLNVGVTAGQEQIVTLIVENGGTAILENVRLSSDKPSEWSLKFEPEQLDRLEPKGTRQVEVKIKPPGNAIAGDYGVGLTASTSESSETMRLRATVSTPTTFGLVGVAVVAIAILAMVLAFIRLGRR